METGGWFGVSVALVAVTGGPSLPDPADLPPGVVVRRSRLSEVVQPEFFDDATTAAELQRLGDARAQLAAYEVSLVVRLAVLRPDLWDLAPEQPGAAAEGWVAGRTFTGITEFFADELALVLGCSRVRAHDLADTSLVLWHQLPATWAALADSRIDWARAQVIAKVLGWQAPQVAGEVIAAVEELAIAWAAAGETVGRLRARVATALLEADAAAADRRRRTAQRNADVHVRPGVDGMAQLVADLPGPVAAACRDAVDRYARMWKADGDDRPIGQLRSMVLADLVLRPWDTRRPPMTAHVTVVAPLPSLRNASADSAGAAGDVHPGSGPAGVVDGQPITAAHLRELLAQLDALCPGGLQDPVDGRLEISLVDPVTGRLRARVTRSELQRLVRGGCPAHPPTRPPSRSGVSPPAGGCGCPVLDVPPAVDRYRPTPAQRRHVRARDRTCRHPGCVRPVAYTDVDHVVPHGAGGVTDCANLCCLCRRHHRIKTHAAGWRYVMTDDGVLAVTTPSGVTRTTWPPGGTLPAELLLVPVGSGVCAGEPGGGAALAGDDPPPF
jgi:hypothetical protein